MRRDANAETFRRVARHDRAQGGYASGPPFGRFRLVIRHKVSGSCTRALCRRSSSSRRRTLVFFSVRPNCLLPSVAHSFFTATSWSADTLSHSDAIRMSSCARFCR